MSHNQLIIVQNLIAPYRVELFNQFYDRGLPMQLYFMCKNEAGRSWEVDLSSQRYPYTIFKGIHFHLGRYQFHFNPGMILKLLQQPRSNRILLGGPWNDVNVFCLTLLKRLHLLRAKLFLWSEANYMSQGVFHSDKWKYYLRRFVLNSGDGGIIYPSTTAKKTLEMWGIRKGCRIQLPNGVQETNIVNAVPRGDWKHDLPNIIIPARLQECDKGQLNFFRSLGTPLIRQARFHLFGDGPDEEQIQQFINENKLKDHIKIYGFCNFSHIASAMKAADIFCLPSFSDPCPLSVYEAMACHLPLLLSSRCGNAEDAIQNSDCGETFAPDDAASIRTAYQNMLNRSADWEKMAEIAYNRFQKEYAYDAFCHRFIQEIWL